MEGSSIVNTHLFLFDGTAIGLYANDDSLGTFQSTLPVSAPFTPTTAGTYYLGITSYGNNPTSTNGFIFDGYNVATPTGAAAGLPLRGWEDIGRTYDSGSYTIRLSSSSTSGGLQVKPGQTLALVGGQVA